MDTKRLEAAYNETFSGLALFYRDTTLPEPLISKYYPGQIIMERGFTDMTCKGGGLQSNFRYLIASAFGKDLSAFNPEAEKAGHIVLTSNAYFKVLDVYTVNGKTQVFLLNIPAHAIGVFLATKTNIEEDIIKKARANFDSKKDLAPVAELQDAEWKGRTKFPLGMNDDGVLFYESPKPANTSPSSATKETPAEKNDGKKQTPWWKRW